MKRGRKMGFLDKVKTSGKNDPLALAGQNVSRADYDIERSCLMLGQMIYKMAVDEGGNDSAVGRLKNESREFYEMVERITQLKANRDSFYANFLQLQGLMECKNCHSQIAFGSVFCSNCGCRPDEVNNEYQSMIVVCKNCGERLTKDNRFCTRCGEKIEVLD